MCKELKDKEMQVALKHMEELRYEIKLHSSFSPLVMINIKKCDNNVW